MSSSTARPDRTQTLGQRGRDVGGLVFTAILLVSLLFSLAVLGILIADQLVRGDPGLRRARHRFPDLRAIEQSGRGRTGPGSHRDGPAGGDRGADRLPVGIMTAVYLEEYAPVNRLTRFIDINIRNLAGVPSVVYGLLGLAGFVTIFAALGMGTGKNVLSGGLTLAVLILPLVIITSAEAIRAVPRGLRESGFGLGASRWQVTRQLVIPAAAPGILTGTVLALSRALGETAPLLLAGAVLGTFSSGASLAELLTGPYAALPTIVYDWAKKPQDEFRALTSAAIIVLLV